MPMSTRTRFIPKILLMIWAGLLALSWPGASWAETSETAAGTGADAAAVSYEAEAGANTFTGNAGPADCGTCSGGKKAGNLYGGSTLQFNGVTADQAGVYTMTVHYISEAYAEYQLG